ncbi:hypothetical protein FA13DRAFT_337210 [Coprinellus micaceus]|uniref:Uncharacterized protein n=1 Tax=Coprinellus micaceus TaxID=71717 RepID=A0A4Y7TBU2_COPMI|nr:hypothetical protein FA13DRAFT_337210 [Coprinellus micaceus]
MEVRVLFCMLVMFVAFFLSGISLLLLSVKFDLPFTIVLAVLFFAAIVIAAFQFIARYGMKWIDALLGKPLHFFSVMASTAAFIVDITRPDPSSWYTISAYGFTMLYHVVAVLYGDRERRTIPGQFKRPRRIAAFCVTLLAVAWVGCVAVTMAWRLHHSKADRSLRYVLVALAGVEALLLGAIAVKDWSEIARAFRPLQQAGSAQDAVERGARTTQSYVEITYRNIHTDAIFLQVSAVSQHTPNY